MKKLLAIIFVFISLSAFAQPIPSNRSTKVVLALDYYNGSTGSYKLPVCAHAPSLNGGLDSLGCVCYVIDSSAVFLRDTIISGGHKWTKILTTAYVSPTPTLYTSDGNLPSSGTRILHGSNTELDVNNVTTLLMIDTVTGHGYYHLIEPNHHQSILSLGNPYTSFTTLSTSTDTTDDESDVSLFTTIHNNPFFIAKNSRSKNTSLAFSDNNADSIITFKGIGNPINIKNLQQGSTSDSVITRDAVGNLKVVAQSSISGIDTTSWKITGNNIYDTSHYIGTNNNEPFIVKANNTRIGYFTPNIGILGDPYGLSDSLSVRWNQGFETMDFGNNNYINGGTGIALSHGAHSLVLHALNGVGINGTANGGDGLYVKNRILGDSLAANNISTSIALLKSEGINRGTVVVADSTKDYSTHTALVDSAAAIRASSGGGSGSVTTMHDSTTNGVTIHWVNPSTIPAPVVTLGNIAATTVATNSINLLPQGSATPPPATGNTLFDSSGINYRGSNGVTIRLSKASLTVNRVDSFPDESGVFLLRKDSTIYQSAATASHGTVTSVGMGGDGTVFNSSVSGSPITTSGTLTPSLSTQTSYKIFGNNTGSTATPTFFSPTLTNGLFANEGTATTMIHGNASGNLSFSQASLTADVSGILPVANGGTGSSTALRKVDTLWRTLGVDSIYFKINGTQYAILDSAGSGGSGGRTYLPGFGIKYHDAGDSVFDADTTYGRVTTSPFKGDTVLAIGDSYLAQSIGTFNPVPNRIGIDTLLDAEPGTYMGGSGTTSIAYRITAQLARSPYIRDVIIVAGINDAIGTTTIGTLNSMDSTTFMGAIYKIQRAVYAYENANSIAVRLFFVTPVKRGTDSTKYVLQKTYEDAELEQCQLHSSQAIDEFNESGITYENLNEYSTDDIHLNKPAGIKRWDDVLVGGMVSGVMNYTNTNPDSSFNLTPYVTAGAGIAFAGSGNKTSPLTVSTTGGGGWNLNGNHVSSQPVLGTNNAYNLEFIADSALAGFVDYNVPANVSLGHGAMTMAATGTQNVTIGYASGPLVSTGGTNTVIGGSTGSAIATGFGNTVIGAGSCTTTDVSTVTIVGSSISCSTNEAVVIGANASVSGTTSVAIGGIAKAAFQATAVGELANAPTQSASLGFNALGQSTGSYNTGVGRTAGYDNTGGDHNTYLGYSAGFGGSGANLSNATAIGANAEVTASNSLILGSGVNVGIGTTAPSYALQVTNGTNTGVVDADSIKQNKFTSGVATYNTVGTLIQATAPLVLSSTTGINAKSTGTTTLYTVPSGKTAVITQAIVKCIAASSITNGPTCDIYTVSSGDIYASTAINALTTTSKIFGFTTTGMSISAASGSTITFEIGTASTGTSQTISVDLIGYTY